MKYIVVMCTEKDEKVVKEIDASCVFDAIDAASYMVDNPEETELVEAYPVL